jgi:hypothetical protein
LTEIQKQIEFLKTVEDLARERNHVNKLKERRMLYDRSRSDCMQKLERGTLKQRVFLNGNDQWQGKAGVDRYEGLEVLLRRRIFFGTGGGLGSLIS